MVVVLGLCAWVCGVVFCSGCVCVHCFRVWFGVCCVCCVCCVSRACVVRVVCVVCVRVLCVL